MRIFTTITSICLVGLLFTACKQTKRYHTDSGLIYTVYTNDKDSIAKMGTTAKIHFIQQAGDSIIDNTYDRMPMYWMVMPGYGNRYNPLEVFDYGIREGDSVITIQLVDSMVSKGILDSIPKWMKSGDTWTTRIKVLKVFSNDSLLQVDKLSETKRVTDLQSSLGTKRIEVYLDSNKKKANSIDGVIYLEEIEKGIGPMPKEGQQISLHYSLETLKGIKMSSTRDSTSKGPALFALGAGFMPEVLENEIGKLPVGSRIKLYIPGVLLFGIEPASKETKLDDDFIVEMELLAIPKTKR